MTKKKKPTATEETKERPILFSGAMVLGILAGKKTQTRRVINPQPLLRDSYDTVAREHGLTPPKNFMENAIWNEMVTGLLTPACPHGYIGSELWVKETWCDANSDAGPCIVYRADEERHLLSDDAFPVEYERYPGKNITWSVWVSDLLAGREGAWRPSIFCYRWASRIQLVILSVRAERLQDISHEEIDAEGAIFAHSSINGPAYAEACKKATARAEAIGKGFSWGVWAERWDSINKDRGYGWDKNPWVWAIDFRKVKP